MDAKKQCRFCGKTNTKIEGVYQSGFFSSTKIGEKEVVDNSIVMYRCSNSSCGIILCESCCEKHGAFKDKVGVFSTKYWTECPKCNSKMITI